MTTPNADDQQDDEHGEVTAAAELAKAFLAGEAPPYDH